MPEKNENFRVTGNHGEIIVSGTSGEILELLPALDCNECRAMGEAGNYCVYSTIARFDVEEWKRAYPGESLGASDVARVDILDLGYWNKDGSYDEAAEDWREILREECGK